MLDPDRRLALSYVPARAREAVGALWALDATLGAVLASGREPMISQIKLAWWRDALERLDEAPAPAEPVLQAIAEHVLPRVAGAELASMEAGWRSLLTDDPLDQGALDAFAQGRGARLFAYTARLLGGTSPPGAERAGEGWALVDLARRSGKIEEADQALKAARSRLLPFRWPPVLRPLGMLAVLAERDARRRSFPFEPQGSPARMLRMLRHRLTGR